MHSAFLRIPRHLVRPRTPHHPLHGDGAVSRNIRDFDPPGVSSLLHTLLDSPAAEEATTTAALHPVPRDHVRPGQRDVVGAGDPVLDVLRRVL